ncbi:MAG TPA: hypothetical protein VHY37_02595 [Tepidisphaeraceae bacterium]|jgi:hypothetical protein|nr:hypothetical protein [Tepidisphaeraceae bacterium]
MVSLPFPPEGQRPEELRQLRDGLLGFSGAIKDEPSDLARNHDHYLHGTPPR